MSASFRRSFLDAYVPPPRDYSLAGRPPHFLGIPGLSRADFRPSQPGIRNPKRNLRCPDRDIAAGWRELESPARLCRPRRQTSRAHPRGKPGFSTFESGYGRGTDSPLEGTRFEPSVPPTRFFRERPRFSSISSARLAIPWSRVPMRVGRVPMLLRARPAAVRPN